MNSLGSKNNFFHIKNSERKYKNFEYVRCDFCNSDKNEFILSSKDFYNNRPGEFNIVRCLKCNLVYTNPRPTKEELLNFYPDSAGYYSAMQKFESNKLNLRWDILTEFYDYPFLKKKKIRKLIQYPSYLRIRKYWKSSLNIPKFIKNGRILEIGCSYGSFLLELKKLGWKVKGVEFNKKAVNYARNKLNLDVVNQDIENFKTDDLFDIIYLRMVLEHMRSPKRVLKKCYSLLKPNGQIIISIPDFSGIERKIYKRYAYTLHLPNHLYHFTPYSITNYLKIINFKKIKIYHQDFDRDLIAPLTYILKERHGDIKIKSIQRVFTHRLIRKTIIQTIIKIFSLLGITSRMTVYAEK